MIDLDLYLQDLLVSGAQDKLKDGLPGVLYWRNYRASYRDYRVAKFRMGVTSAKLHLASTVARRLDGSSLAALRDLRLPQFSQKDIGVSENTNAS